MNQQEKSFSTQQIYGLNRGGQQDMIDVDLPQIEKGTPILQSILKEQAEINKQTSASIEHIYIKLHELLGNEVVEKKREGGEEIGKNNFGLIGELRFMQNQAEENLKKLYGINATLSKLIG